MAFLQKLYKDEHDDFTRDCWFTEYGPLGVSGFNCDGKEVGGYCSLCEVVTDSQSLAQSHFAGKRHATKLQQYRRAQQRLVVESSTGNPDDPDNLFLPNYCKVCDADLIQEEQAETHYMSEKHQKKVRHYFLVKVGAKELHPSKTVDPEVKKKELQNMSKMEYCPLCDCEFTAPVVARAHYAGKKHAKKLREKGEIDALDESGVDWQICRPCGIELSTKQEYLLHVITVKHRNNAQEHMSDEDKVKQLAQKREELETKLTEEAAKKQHIENELKFIDHEIESLNQ